MLVQSAPVCELQPACLASVGTGCMLLLYMEPVRTRLFKFGAANIARDRFHGRVDGAVPLQIRRELGRVGAQWTTHHARFPFHRAHPVDYHGRRLP